MSDPSSNERVEGSIGARGPEYRRLVEQRREHERVRKREARKRQTAEEREHERERKRRARLGQTPEQREHEKEREGRRNRAKLRPFMAVDGEGGGTDALGRQNYLLMVASGEVQREKNAYCTATGSPCPRAIASNLFCHFPPNLDSSARLRI